METKMSLSEHVTALFVGGLYYWFIGQEATADMCWRTATQIIDMKPSYVGDA
jgi:hypothetical protein